MRPGWTLDDDEYFGEDFQPGEEDEIQVLVELSAVLVPLPPAAEDTEDDLSEVRGRLVGTKRKYAHSEVGSFSSSQRLEILKDLDMHVESVLALPLTTEESAAVEPFKWKNNDHDQETEEQQRERYRLYLEHNLASVLTEKDLCVFGLAKDSDLLTVEVPGRDGIEIAGRADLLVLSKVVSQNPRRVEFLPGVQLLIEVNQTIRPSADMQDTTELMALDLLSTPPVMALLKDLKNHWEFYWVSDMIDTRIQICKALIDQPGEAFQVIRTLLTQSSDEAVDIRLPFSQEPVKRRKLEKMLPSNRCNIREEIQRYYDVASELGPDIEMARAVANRIVRSIPALRYRKWSS